MAKYIDRAALFNSLTNAKTVAEVFAAIQDAPAADVQEIRRGRWTDDGRSLLYKCSVCGLFGLADMPYCPNCGAAMKGSIDND